MLLVLSIIASIVIWGILQSLNFALVLVGSIFIHEYGHYYWMGREGINNRTMFFIPPFGAVAMAKEMWPSRGAESRISLAGPAFGLISVLFFLILWLWTQQPIFAASIVLASYINLFNLLLPIAILDGGRVIKSILFSINTKLGESFFVFGFFFLVFTVVGIPIMSPLLALIIGYMLWQDYSGYRYAKKTLPMISQTLRHIEDIKNKPRYSESNNNLALDNAIELVMEESRGYRNINTMKKHEKELGLLLNPRIMNRREIFNNIAIFVAIMIVYLFMIKIMGGYVDLNLYTLSQYFQ